MTEISQTLFDRQPGNDFSDKKHDESEYDFLMRSDVGMAKSIRLLLEAWFSRYPDEHRWELAQRIRSGSDAHFASAFFELYLHEVFWRLGSDIAIHPCLPGVNTAPVFLVRDDQDSSWFCEATVVTETSEREAGQNALQNVLLE